MADKKYYWLKLHRDFFKRHDIQIIEGMPNGKDYILFYLKLLVESIDHEGCLRFSDTIPYNDDMLATITHTNVDIVRSAMKIFTELQMITILDDSTIFMQEVEKMIGISTQDDHTRESTRLRVQRYRERKKQELLPNRYNAVTCNGEIDIEKEIEIEKEVKHKHGEYQNVLLTDKELEKLKTEFPKDWQERIDNLSAYMKSKGASYKDHLATIRNWARRDKKKETEKQQNNKFNQIEKNDYNFDALEELLEKQNV